MSKKLAVIFGVIFVIVGVLGFVSNPIVGRPITNALFATDALHDIIHIFVGVILIIAGSKSAGAARKALNVFGIVYLILALDGFLQTSLLGFITANTADTYLHLVLGIVLLAVGMSGEKNAPMMNSSMPM